MWRHEYTNTTSSYDKFDIIIFYIICLIFSWFMDVLKHPENTHYFQKLSC